MRRRRIIVGSVAAAALAGTTIGLAGTFARGAKPPPLTGVALDRPVPVLPLRDERGRRASLAQFHGRTVVLAPSLTLCHEVCPITSGALEQIKYDAARAGVASRVGVLEVSVDPWRDSPARLRAYRKSTGVTFHLLTGTHRELTGFWKTFGVSFFPTGSGRSFDVAHTDGVFFIDARGRLRIAVVGMPDIRSKLAPGLQRMLGKQGLANLRRPQAAWTVAQALDDLGRLVGQPIPERPLP